MNPKLAVRESRRYGKGVFAAKGPLRKHEILFVFGGHILTAADENQLCGSMVDKPIELSEHFSIGPRRPADLRRMPQHYVNHSCAPNAGFYGQIFLVAMQRIKCGEEITYDYGMVMHSNEDKKIGFAMRCGCRTKCCRGLITEDDWRLPELQKRYDGYFQWYLQEKISRLKVSAKRRALGSHSKA